MTQNPVTRNTLGNTGTQLNTVPVPVNFPHLSVQVQFFLGMGTGGPKKPQGHLCLSLLKAGGDEGALKMQYKGEKLDCKTQG